MTEFRIDDMPCCHCASAITRAVWSLDAAATVEIDHASKRVRVESPLGPYKIAAAIAGAGFAPSAVRCDEADFLGDPSWNGCRRTGSGWHCSLASCGCSRAGVTAHREAERGLFTYQHGHGG